MRPPFQSLGYLTLVAISLLLLQWPLQCSAADSSFEWSGGNLEDDETPPNFSDHAQSSGFKEETAFSFNGDQIPVNLHPMSRDHALDESFFKPSLQVDVHSVHFEDDKPPSLVQATIEHEHYPYVNLESVEPFLAEPVTCRIARPDEETDLDLHFETEEGYNMARRHWGAENATIRFLVEGLHCFEAAGSRSMYHATAIMFHSNRKVVITAEPLHAQVYWGSDWGHALRLRNVPPPSEHRIVPRRSLDITHDLASLQRRGFDLHTDWHIDGVNVSITHRFNKGQDWGPRHQFFDKPKWYNGPFLNFSCINCHARGAWDAYFDVKINISPFGNSPGCKNRKFALRKRSEEAVAFHERHASIQPLIYAQMEADRVLRHKFNAVKVLELQKRGTTHYPVLQSLACTEEDPTYPVCHGQQVPRALRDRSVSTMGRCNQFLRPIRAIFKAASCGFKKIIGKGEECGEKWKQDFDELIHTSLKEYMKELIKTHLEHVEISLHVVEDISVAFQLEVAGTVGVSFWFDVDILTQRWTLCPAPEGVTVCNQPQAPVLPSFGWFLSLSGGSPTGTTLSSLPVGKAAPVPNPVTGLLEPARDANGKQKWDSIANKMTPARNKNKGGALEADKTQSPAKMSVAQKNQWPFPILDVVPLRISVSLALEAAITGTLPGFRVMIPAGGTMLWRPLLEDKEQHFENSMAMRTEYLKAKLEFQKSTVTIRMSAGPTVKFKIIPMYSEAKPTFDMTGISDPLAMGGHFQPVRFDHIFSLAGPGDPDNCAEHHVKYEMVYRIGMDAYVMIFFQRVADLSWIGNLQKSSIASEMVRGLWFSKRLVVVCLAVQFDLDEKNRKLNEKLSEMQEPIAKKVRETGEFISGKANRPVGFEHGVQSWLPNNETGRELIDLLDWMHFVTTSEPSLAWKDCDASHFDVGCDTNDPFQVADMTACPEEGMCEPFSTFYIPKGINEANQRAQDDWLRSYGIDPNDTLAGTIYDLYNMSLNYNSSTVDPGTATLPAPTPLASDPSISSDWQDGLNYNASNISSIASNATPSAPTSAALDLSKPDTWIGGPNYDPNAIASSSDTPS